MLKRILTSILIISFILLATLALTTFGRGYRFDFGKKILTSTGILAVSSHPEGASIFINDKLTSATNTSINIIPDWYDLKIVKEGYIPWQKRVSVKGEIVTKADVLLLPKNPSFRPLTTGGVLSPILSPSSTELAYIVPFDASQSSTLQKGGIWVWDLKEGPLIPLGNGPRLLVRSTANLDFTHASLIWSPDEKQIGAFFHEDNQVLTKNLLLPGYIMNTSLGDQIPIPVSSHNLSIMLNDWKNIEQEKTLTLLSSFPPLLGTILKETTRNIQFSEDENKILYQATASATIPPIIIPPLIGTNSTTEERTIHPENIYIYDIKEDKNYKIKEKSPTKIIPNREEIDVIEEIVTRLSQNSQEIRWYPDSKHILMLESGTIYITEYDGLNKTTVYAGPLEDKYVFPWPAGGRILILTNYNKAASLYPNLYAIDLR